MNFGFINMQIPQFNDANCLTVGDPDLFFYNGKEKNSKEQINAAKKVCFGCVHKEECRQFALDNEIVYGVWGGISESERRRILRRNKKQEVSKTLEEAMFLRSQGYDNEEIGRQLGINAESVRVAFKRHYEKYRIGYVPKEQAS